MSGWDCVDFEDVSNEYVEKVKKDLLLFIDKAKKEKKVIVVNYREEYLFPEEFRKTVFDEGVYFWPIENFRLENPIKYLKDCSVKILVLKNRIRSFRKRIKKAF
jgi:hypothetical protein